MTSDKKYGFDPILFEDSKLLILGSFPSKKSREIQFYYGNKQNRFWKTVCSFFGEEIPETVSKKIDFLRRRKIALWDMAKSCRIDGSADADIREVETVDIARLLKDNPVEKILLNGSLAFELFEKNYIGDIPYRKMPSTSPANPRFSKEVWWEELKILQ